MILQEAKGYAEYKEKLIKSVKDILEILGYDIERELLEVANCVW